MECMCTDDDPYVCYMERENLGIVDAETIDECGGPCGCKCHSEDYDEEAEAERDWEMNTMGSGC